MIWHKDSLSKSEFELFIGLMTHLRNSMSVTMRKEINKKGRPTEGPNKDLTKGELQRGTDGSPPDLLLLMKRQNKKEII